jgi:5,5'-dehydrodivanillate O-demethylase oxygenase subunit
MLSTADNERLTQVGRGTPMGELLRRYWHPIAPTAELDDRPTKRVRVMGEELVLYKDRVGRYGLLGRYCPHRGMDLSLGMPEECGLRCSYHGWRFDEAGHCIEQPFEETVNPGSTFKQRIRTTAYPVRSAAGLLWAYMGPPPIPLLPDWEPFSWENGFVQIACAEIPCNWFQCYENSVDPIHFEWLHMNGSATSDSPTAKYVHRRVHDSIANASETARAPRHLDVRFEEFEYGFIYGRLMEGGSLDSPQWTVGRASLWPNAFFTTRFEWYVPVDDRTTLVVSRHFDRVPREQEPYVQDRIPYWYPSLTDPKTGELLRTHPMNQDFAAFVGQRTIADRSQEHLGESDRGIIMLRKRMFEQMKIVAEGGEPKAVLRDEAVNRCIPLPLIERGRITGEDPNPAAQAIDGEPPDFFHLAGQPEDIREAQRSALGLTKRAPGRR